MSYTKYVINAGSVDPKSKVYFSKIIKFSSILLYITFPKILAVVGITPSRVHDSYVLMTNAIYLFIIEYIHNFLENLF